MSKLLQELEQFKSDLLEEDQQNDATLIAMAIQRIKYLEQALDPFAKVFSKKYHLTRKSDDLVLVGVIKDDNWFPLTFKDFRRAMAAAKERLLK